MIQAEVKADLAAQERTKEVKQLKKVKPIKNKTTVSYKTMISSKTLDLFDEDKE
jgi:hypothetical protein